MNQSFTFTVKEVQDKLSSSFMQSQNKKSGNQGSFVYGRNVGLESDGFTGEGDAAGGEQSPFKNLTTVNVV